MTPLNLSNLLVKAPHQVLIMTFILLALGACDDTKGSSSNAGDEVGSGEAAAGAEGGARADAGEQAGAAVDGDAGAQAGEQGGAEAGTEAGDEAGAQGGEMSLSAMPICSNSIVLTCDSGRVTVDSSTGSAENDTYLCGDSFTYPGKELIFEFIEEEAQTIQVFARQIEQQFLVNYVLFALEKRPLHTEPSELYCAARYTDHRALSP